VTDSNDKLDRAIELLKEPVELDPAIDVRVMNAIASEPRPNGWKRRLWFVLDWLLRGRSIRVSPLGGLALAAGVAVIVVYSRSLPIPSDDAAVSFAAEQSSAVQFVIVAPTASAVSLVGDFNDWDPDATPMQLVADNRVWTVTIPLNSGRYRYAFLVNGDTWLSDPSAPPVQDDEFGRPGSVVTIGET